MNRHSVVDTNGNRYKVYWKRVTLRFTCSIQATQLEFSLTSVNYSGSKNTTAGLMHGTSSGSGGPRGHFQVLLLSILNVMSRYSTLVEL